MAGRPDARLPWAPAWETLSICCHCVMAGCGNGLATSRESRRNIMNRLDLKKVNVCVTDQKQFSAAANSGVGGVIALLLAVSAKILARLAGRPPPPELHHPLRRRPRGKRPMTRSDVKRFVALPSAMRTAVWFAILTVPAAVAAYYRMFFGICRVGRRRHLDDAGEAISHRSHRIQAV